MYTKSTKDMVMQRVERVHRIRALVHPLRLKVFFFLTGLLGTAFSVSVPQVFENMFGRATFFGYFEYLGTAFIHTELFVQTTLLIMVIAGCLYLKDFLQDVRESDSVKGW